MKLTHEQKFVLLCIYYAESVEYKHIIKGMLKLDIFKPSIQALTDKGLLIDEKINPVYLSFVQAFTRQGDDPAKMREDLMMITLSKILDRVIQQNIKLPKLITEKIKRL